MSDYKNERKTIKQANRAVAEANDAQLALTQFFALHNELRDCDASRSLAVQYFAGDDLTLEALEESYAGHPKFKEMLCKYESEKELRETLEGKIVELLAGGTSPDNLRAAKSTFRFKSINQLKEKLAELERRITFREQTPEQLRNYIKRPQPGYSELPTFYQHRETLLTLPPAQLRHFIAKYGSDAINKVLNQKG